MRTEVTPTMEECIAHLRSQEPGGLMPPMKSRVFRTREYRTAIIEFLRAPAVTAEELATARADVGTLMRIGAALCSTVPDPEFPPRMNREARQRIARETDIADGQCKGFAIVLRDIALRFSSLASRLGAK